MDAYKKVIIRNEMANQKFVSAQLLASGLLERILIHPQAEF